MQPGAKLSRASGGMEILEQENLCSDPEVGCYTSKDDKYIMYQYKKQIFSNE